MNGEAFNANEVSSFEDWSINLRFYDKSIGNVWDGVVWEWME